MSGGVQQILYDRETGWGPFSFLPLGTSSDGKLFLGRGDATVEMAASPLP